MTERAFISACKQWREDKRNKLREARIERRQRLATAETMIMQSGDFDRTDKIMALRAAGHTLWHIGALFQITGERVRKIINRRQTRRDGNRKPH